MARKGDLIFVSPARVGGPTREGEIIEVIEGDLRVRYRVRWNDGHESVLAPGAGAARIEPAQGRAKSASGTGRQRSPAKASTAKRSPGRKVAAKKAASRRPISRPRHGS
ncbi:MAG TPA: DUF1918 domain-containing protein [Actinomycetota bacterium]|nr:DUF1918 domain-containing protein [Actinomycetota bacterium]